MAFFGLPDREIELGEDVAVYTWGDDSYDGLGDALQEGGDDLNDETFGVGDVGKDFDFSNTGIAEPVPHHQQQQQGQQHQPQEQRKELDVAPGRPTPTSRQSGAAMADSIWGDQSAFSFLPRVNGSSRTVGEQPRQSPVPAQNQNARFSPFSGAIPSTGQVPPSHLRVRTLQEIEAEMLANAERQREEERRRRQLLLQQQQQQQQQQEQQIQQQQQQREILLYEQQQQRERELIQEQIYQERRLQQRRETPEQQQLLQRRLEERHVQLEQQAQLREQRQQLYLDPQQQTQLHLEQQHQQQQLRLEQERQLRQEQHQTRLEHQTHLQRLVLQQQQQRTPPPRMIPSVSPRFMEHQRQILLLQQQQDQQQRLQELHEQLKLEELERRMAATNLNARNDALTGNARRTPAGYTVAELQAAQAIQQHQQQQLQLLQQQQQYRRQSSRSPAMSASPQQHLYPTHDGGSFPQNQSSQLQSRLLQDLTHVDFVRDLPGASTADQEALRLEAMRKIVEAEKMEEKRRRKAAKIAHMSRYNDLMTQSDKDFITRIQVSQLVTQDPYADDFYAQVYGAILRSRMGLQAHDERVLKFGSGGGIGLGLTPKGGSRRPSAMQRMEQQVERIVSNARKREEEKGLHAIHSLQGALGKTSGRSYKAAPRQLLQVDAATGASPTLSHAAAHISRPSVHHEGAAKEAAKLGREALGSAVDTDGLVRKDPLSNRETLVILEELYDVVLRVEQMRRDQPLPEDEAATEAWKQEYEKAVDSLWDELRVMVPLETSNPHPFISLLTPTKGKKILPRVTRHLSSQRMLTLLTLLVACFNQLDVVIKAPVFNSAPESQEHADVERQTQAFLSSVMQSILPVVSVANLRLVTGLLGLLLDRSNIVAVAQTRPGLALLTLFLSRVEVIKQTIASTPEAVDTPTIEESQQWRLMFDHLFQLLGPYFVSLFPSSRITNQSNNSAPTDIIDQPVWQFLAALALHAGPEQHQILVSALREKILDNVLSVNKGWVHDEDERQTKLANVNLFLHALNLDSSQIAM